jgi:citrate lyase beta subunit
VQPGLDGVILPKVESAAGLATIDWLLGQFERDRGLPPGGIDLIPIIEMARGLDRLGAILGVLLGMSFGSDWLPHRAQKSTVDCSVNTAAGAWAVFSPGLGDSVSVGCR